MRVGRTDPGPDLTPRMQQRSLTQPPQLIVSLSGLMVARPHGLFVQQRSIWRCMHGSALEGITSRWFGQLPLQEWRLAGVRTGPSLILALGAGCTATRGSGQARGMGPPQPIGITNGRRTAGSARQHSRAALTSIRCKQDREAAHMMASENDKHPCGSPTGTASSHRMAAGSP